MGAGIEMENRARARLGSVLRGKYTLDRVLGIGGMAVVYAATHRNQKQFAIKMLHPELSLREDVRQRFLREGYAANSVKHAGAVTVIDDDTAEDGSAFLVMELLDGGTVDEVWEKLGRRIPLDAALVLGFQLLDVLVAAHAKGIVHRDIKPPNLFLTREGQLKVLDFGIARVRDVAGASSGTGTGFLLGTPAFMSPEQAYGKTSLIDAQTDVWAAGATLFTLLSGQTVHDGETPGEIVIKAATQQARSLAVVAPGVPPQVVSVVDRALVLDKADRWPTAEMMRDALARAHRMLVGHPPTTETLAGLWRGLPTYLGSTDPTGLPVVAGFVSPAPATPGAQSPVIPTPLFVPLSPAPAQLAAPSPPPAAPQAATTPVGAGTVPVASAPSPRPWGTPAAITPAGIGTTQSKPVSIPPPAGLTAARAAMLAAGVLVPLALAGTILAVVLSRRSPADEPSAPTGAAAGNTGGATIASAAAPAPSPSSAPLPSPAPTTTATAIPEPSGTIATVAIDQLPSATLAPPPTPAPAPAPTPMPTQAQAQAPASPPPAAPRAATPAPTATATATSAPTAATTAARPTGGCSPPYYYDQLGRKVFKPQCVN